jgi:hypothetical protein
MSVDAGNSVGWAAPERSPSLLEDLALLLDGPRALYLRLGPEGAMFTVKSPETLAFGDTVDCRWVRMTSDERAKAVRDWIRKAAAYYRRPKVRYGLQRRAMV